MKSLHCFNLEYYTPKLWERIVLSFCALQTYATPSAVVWYKRFADRIYIIGYVREHGVPQEGPVSDEKYGNAGNN